MYKILYELHQQLTPFLKNVHVKQVHSANFKSLKGQVQPGSTFMHVNFSENFTHAEQNEIQSVYWVTPSSTLYTAMVYFKKPSSPRVSPESDDLQSFAYVVVSDYMSHDKYALKAFNDLILMDVQNKHGPIFQLDYQLDGATQHFEQKFTLCTITLNQVPNRWLSSATPHGKGRADGIGGIVKHPVAEVVHAGG